MTPYIDVADLKAHMNIVGTDDDALLADKISAASEWIAAWVLLDPLLPVPEPIKEATRQLAAEFYENREASTNEPSHDVQFGVFYLILPYRNFGF